MLPPDEHPPDENHRGWKAPATEIQPFAENAPIAIHEGNLPHWEQTGTTYFITFRLGDSLPAGKLREFQTMQQGWLRTHGRGDASQLATLPPEQQRDYHR